MSDNLRKFLLFLTLTLTLTLSVRPDDFFKIKTKVLNESRLKLGFLYLTPILMIDHAGYTSSIYTYQEEEYPDWTGDFGLGLRASVIAANRLILQVEDRPHYSYYLENKHLRAWSNRFSANAYSHASLFNFKAGFKRNDLNRRPNLEFSRPYKYVDSQWNGEVDFGRRSDIYLTAYALFSELAYGDVPYAGGYNLAGSLNRRENVFGLKMNKRVFTGTIIYASYERSNYRFEQSSERDAKAQQIALGVQFPEIGRLQGSFQIGVKRFEPGNPLFQNMQRANGRGEVRMTLAERVRLNASYGLDTLFSYGSNDLYYDHAMFGGGVEIYLTRFLKIGANYQDGRLKYHSFFDQELQRNDRIRNQRYSLAIPFFSNTSIGFSYTIYRLTSDALGLDYTRNFWGGFLSYGF